MKIVADNKIPFLKGVFESIAKVEYFPGSLISPDMLLDVDILFTRSRTICNKELLEGTSVKFIASASIGFDHIDQKYCEENNITWTNAPGCNSGAVQQYVFSALIELAKKYKFKLKNKTIGIIGVGNIGTKIAEMARYFGMNCLLNDPPRERLEGTKNYVPIDKLIHESDIVTFHVPLNNEGPDKTYHLGDEMLLSKLKSDAILINTSRGEVIKTEALKQALNKSEIKAIIDVWESEPNIDKKLLELVDIATPHIAGYSYDGKANGTAMCVQQASRFFNLGLNNWYPKDIPLPENNVVDINDLKGLSFEDVLSKVMQTSYNILRDDEALRDNPNKFESLRDNYSYRREFQAYTINTGRLSINEIRMMKGIGIKILE